MSLYAFIHLIDITEHLLCAEKDHLMPRTHLIDQVLKFKMGTQWEPSVKATPVSWGFAGFGDLPPDP